MNRTDYYCASCKFFEQGKTCSYCSNPKQTNQDYKNYVYYNFDCEFHEKGIAKSRIKYMEDSGHNTFLKWLDEFIRRKKPLTKV